MRHDAHSFYQLSCQDRMFDDYLLLGGGVDIDPQIYGEKRSPYTQHPSKERDARNIEAINKAIEEGKPIFGICRGLQLLDAVFGGRLIQHSVGHPSKTAVFIFDEPHEKPKKIINGCAECHHQVVDMGYTNGVILGYSSYEYKAYDGFKDKFESRNIVPEIVWWPDKKALAVQFHPEWHDSNHPMNEYLRGLLKEKLGLENVL